MLFLMLWAALSSPAQFRYDTVVKAHDFEGVTVDGRPYRLYDSPAKRIVLCFWSVDCDHCHDFLKALRRHTDPGKDFELVTFALADSPRQVRRKARRMRLHGWHFFDEAGWDAQPFLDYDVTTTPTIVLIDEKKQVVGLAYDWEEFEELITENGERKTEN